MQFTADFTQTWTILIFWIATQSNCHNFVLAKKESVSDAVNASKYRYNCDSTTKQLKERDVVKNHKHFTFNARPRFTVAVNKTVEFYETSIIELK